MRRQKWSGRITGLAVALAVFFVAAERATTDEATKIAETPDESNYFQDKVVGVSVDESTSVERRVKDTWLVNAKLVNLNGRRFIVGEMLVPSTDDEKKVFEGIVEGFAWERIQSFRVLTRKQFDAYTSWHQARSGNGE